MTLPSGTVVLQVALPDTSAPPLYHPRNAYPDSGLALSVIFDLYAFVPPPLTVPFPLFLSVTVYLFAFQCA